jgi:hypothetical protein
LHEGRGFIFPDVRPKDWHILSLGPDGMFYPSAMFMHTQTLPIGDSRVDTALEAFNRAQADPILRTLIIQGVGPIYRAALEVDPAVAAMRDDRLQQEELLFDLLASPELTLRITEQLLSSQNQPLSVEVRSLPLNQAIRRLFEGGIEGKERKVIRAAAELLAPAAMEAIVDIMLAQDFSGKERAIYFTTMMLMKGEIPRLALIRKLAENDALFDKVITLHPGESPAKKDLRREFYKILCCGDSVKLAKLIEQAESDRNAEDVLIEVAHELPQLEMMDVFGPILWSLPLETQRSFFRTLDKDSMAMTAVESLSEKFPGQMRAVMRARDEGIGFIDFAGSEGLELLGLEFAGLKN